MDRPNMESAPQLGARLMSLAIGLVVAFWNVDHRILFGAPSIWRDVGYDQGGGLAGLRFFQSESWGYPLLVVRSIGSNGTGIIFTDSNALLALIAKTFSFLPIDSERWWGMWFLALFAGQSFSICHLLQSLGVRRLEILATSGFVGALTPFFLFRLQHPALAAHFLVILAMSHLVRISRHEIQRSNLNRIAMITLVGFLVHPYIFAMCVIVFFAGTWVCVNSRQVAVRDALRPMMALLLATLLITWQSGGFGRGTAPSTAGPIYSTSLLSMISPQKTSLISDGNMVEPSTSWEGFAWIGFGALFSIAVGLVLLALKIRDQSMDGGVKRTWILVGVSMVPFWFALGPELHLIDTVRVPYPFAFSRMVISLVITVAVVSIIMKMVSSEKRKRGPLMILVVLLFTLVISFDEHLYSRVLDYLRANGRFVWVPSYLLIAAGLFMISRFRRRVFGVLVCVVIVVLQIADTGKLRDWPNEIVIEDSVGRREGIDLLRELVRPLEGVSIWPPQHCLNSAQSAESFRDVVIASSIENTPVRSSYAARPVVESCDLEQLEGIGTRIAIVQNVEDLSPDVWTCSPVWTLHDCEKIG